MQQKPGELQSLAGIFPTFASKLPNWSEVTSKSCVADLEQTLSAQELTPDAERAPSFW